MDDALELLRLDELHRYPVLTDLDSPNWKLVADGYVDGYVSNGQYYAGTPQGYDPTLRRVATGAVGGAALGAVAGAVIPGVSLLEGAVIGAAVGGLAGAIWADRDNDGRVDGYVQNGQYYAGAPSSTAPAPTYTAPTGAGERG